MTRRIVLSTTRQRLPDGPPVVIAPRLAQGPAAGGGHTGTLALASPTQRAPQRPMRCFVVEDSPVIRQNLVATLEEMLPLQVVGMAEDEQGAVDWLRRTPTACDLMIIDIFLKAGTGLGVLQCARALNPGLPLVVLTNYATADMQRRCLALGANRVFDKSGQLEDLLAYCETLASPLH
jgi:CheY-like chemotaxis protein